MSLAAPLVSVIIGPASATEVPPAPGGADEAGEATHTAAESPAKPVEPSAIEPATTRVESPLESPASQGPTSAPGVIAPPSRSGEGMMVAGWSFVGGGVTLIGMGVAFAVTDVYNSGAGELARIATAGPSFIVGGAATLIGAGLVGGGYVRWSQAYKTWEGSPGQPDPRGRPGQQRPALLLMPGGVLLVAGLVTFTLYGLSEVDELVVPAAISTGTGVALLGTGLVRRSRLQRRATQALLSPSFGRTRQGTWTGGVVMRW